MPGISGPDASRIVQQPTAAFPHPPGRARLAKTGDRMSTRRAFLAAAGGFALGGCATGWGIGSAAGIDARVATVETYLATSYPQAAPLVQSAAAVLYIPLVTEVALGTGGSYGEGALKAGGQVLDYYSAAQATFGLQAGAQQYSHALIFRTPEALAAFRAMPGWVAGADAFYALPNGGMDAGVDSLAWQMPVVAMIFGQSGLMAGATIEGTKYTRIQLSRS